MDDKKKKYIIIGAVVLVVLYFVFIRKKEDKNDGSQAFESISSKVASSGAAISTATKVTISEEDEEYQLLLRELADLHGGKLPSYATGYSVALLKAEIASLKKMQEAYKEYAELEDDDIQLSDAELAEKYNTIASITALINEVKARKQKEAAAAAEHRSYLERLADNFIKNATAYPGLGAATLSKYNWDTGMLMEIKALSAADKKELNKIFLEKTDGKGILCCSYQAEAKSLWKYQKSMEIPYYHS